MPEAVGRNRAAHRLASGLDPFGHNLTWPPRTKSDPGQLCFARTGPEEKCRMWSGSVSLEEGRIWLRSGQTGRMYKNGSNSDPIMMIWATSSAKKKYKKIIRSGSGKSDPGRFWLAASRNGHNWPQPNRIRHVYWVFIIEGKDG